MFFSAPLIAGFYSQPALITVLRIIALTLIIRTFQTVPNVILNKSISFQVTARTSLISSITSGIVAIILALLGAGLWSLVVQQLLSAILGMLLSVISTKWIPRIEFSFARLKNLFSFGSRMLLIVLCDSIFGNR